MSPALLRVRAPYFVRNTIALIVATSIPLGVYCYTINVLSKDEFSDIPIPPIADDELAKLRKEHEDKKKTAWIMGKGRRVVNKDYGGISCIYFEFTNMR